jgi:asparagine synthase (glutamine-hydrolysing)
MCGITAIWGEDDPTLIRQMMDSLIHRGPDASGMPPDHGCPSATGASQ